MTRVSQGTCGQNFGEFRRRRAERSTSAQVTAFGGAPWLTLVFSSVPPAVFYFTFFFGHVVAEACVRPRRYWVDKLCIHQRRSFLKVAGLRALPLFVRKSSRLCVLHSDNYFSRLWCSCGERGNRPRLLRSRRVDAARRSRRRRGGVAPTARGRRAVAAGPSRRRRGAVASSTPRAAELSTT